MEGCEITIIPVALIVWGGGGVVSRSQTLYLKKQRGKGLVKLPWQIGSDLTGFFRC